MAKYCNERVCVSVFLSASISPEPHAWYLPHFCACCLWPWFNYTPQANSDIYNCSLLYALWDVTSASDGDIKLILILLSAHDDRQGVDISFTVCLFVRLQISPAMIKLAWSNSARRFISVLGREISHSGELCSPRSPKSDESARGEWTQDRHVWITVSPLHWQVGCAVQR